MILAVDCDGTIRQPRLQKDGTRPKFISTPEDQEPIPGADTGIQIAEQKGWTIIGVTNQGGVAAGHKSLAQAIKEQQVTLRLLPELDSILLCPDFEGVYCWYVRRNEPAICYDKKAFPTFGSFRKPGPGMLQLIRFWYESVSDLFYYVGDRPEDEQAAEAAGFNFLDAELWRHRNLLEHF